ncbi:uncharacterized protein TORIP isoform X2 [Fopius arisanus]|nr:PREDICTED: uncharacterized protein LOC105268252 isoform X2 [Fopius arisanus]
MLSPPKSIPFKSPTSRSRSRTPTVPESENSTSGSDSEGSPETAPGYSSRSRSSVVSGSPRQSSTSEIHRRTPRTPGPQAPRDRFDTSKTSTRNSGKQFQHNYLCWGCVVILGIFLVIWGALNSDAMDVSFGETQEPELNEKKMMFEALENLGKNIDDIRARFREQYPSIWRDLEAGIAEVIRNPRRPTIFLLFSSEDNPMFCLAKMIGNASKTALRSEEDLLLSPEDLGNDYGMALEKLKGKIQRQKVVIVEHLLDIHPEAMKAFHNLCDRENPLVKEAIYILTMKIDGYTNEKLIEFVEKQLTLKLQGKIDEEKLQALITRMTDGAIIHVQPEPGVKSCPLRY